LAYLFFSPLGRDCDFVQLDLLKISKRRRLADNDEAGARLRCAKTLPKRIISKETNQN
jgi:hypothetical protein